MGLRINKSFKIAPGLRVRLGSKSNSLSIGSKAGRVTMTAAGGGPRQCALPLECRTPPPRPPLARAPAAQSPSRPALFQKSQRLLRRALPLVR
ncbi:DUF4236 domain-containing protein [Streptomyces sp. NPDC001083]|uniref:DUF4236 domain-containing protein n=1 Tax=Streptomyces sp. NPDC001083 TaxID=3364545 RepID=UPI003682D04B